MNAPAALAQDEAFARIRLLRSPNIGPISYRQLIARFGDAVRALEALPDLASRKGGGYALAPADRVSREIDAVRKAGARLICSSARPITRRCSPNSRPHPRS